jgi:NCAIR mutase (PurE)-related protein
MRLPYALSSLTFAKDAPTRRRLSTASLQLFGTNPLRTLGLRRSITTARSARVSPKSSWEIVRHGNPLLVTRADEAAWQAVKAEVAGAEYHAVARCITLKGVVAPGVGTIALCCAGTADVPVAEEAAVTAELLGNTVDRLYDIGVAGLHRLLSQRARLETARVIIVVAGMEGALPSVVAGMVGVPVIAVPTSIGYGASFGGVAALLGMLNSCANGVSVVNIDNGYGAGCIASMINHL